MPLELVHLINSVPIVYKNFTCSRSSLKMVLRSLPRDVT